MTDPKKNFAIVIGIDAYKKADWKLKGAVADALAFADWAVSAGGVPNENLFLLLAPEPGQAPARPHDSADVETIDATIQRFQDGLAKRAPRLFFYYAGHGSSAPTVRGQVSREPVLLPANVDDLPLYARRLLGFDRVIPCFLTAGPREQFFFVDACRDFALEGFAPAAALATGRWIGTLPEAGQKPREQFLLYATSPGEKAQERGRGVFGKHLLDGLRGAPGAMEWSNEFERYDLSFSTLAKYVRARIAEDAKRAFGENWERYIQVPEQDSPPTNPDTVIASVDSAAVADLDLKVRISPATARAACQVSVRYPGPKTPVLATQGPPVGSAVSFQLKPFLYRIVAEAQDWNPAREVCDLREPKSIDLKLERPETAMAASPPPMARGGGGGQGIAGARRPSGKKKGGGGGGRKRAGRKSGGRFATQSRPRVRPAALSVSAEDRSVTVVVQTPDQRRLTGQGSVVILRARPGIYRAYLVLPGGQGAETPFEVDRGESKTVLLKSPPPAIGAHQLEALRLNEIYTSDREYVHPSELIGGIVQARLASLLGFAALAAHWTDGLARLRKLGVEPVTGLHSGESAVIVIVGANAETPSPRMDVTTFLASARVNVLTADGAREVPEGRFATLSGFDSAAQWQQKVPPGVRAVELTLPGRAVTRYAITALPNRVSVLVAVAEDVSRVDVQQYSLPVGVPAHFPADRIRMEPSDLRRIDLLLRYYAHGQPIPTRQLNEALYFKWLDPLLGCLAGYSLIRSGEHRRYVGRPLRASRRYQIEPSAMRNMLKFFGELPDSHVLAGLCEPKKRSQHYERAIELGPPMFAEGFRVLAKAVPEGITRQFRAVRDGLVFTSPWTAWTSREVPR